MQIPVYILTSDTSSEHVLRLRELFDSPVFEVYVADITIPNNNLATKNISQEKALELYRFLYSLDHAAGKYPTSHVLVIKDTSKSDSSPEYIANTLSWINTNNRSSDIIYLAKWLDKCEKYQKRRRVPNTMTDLIQSTSPKGTQALFFSPNGRDVLLGKNAMRNSQPFKVTDKPLGETLTQEIEKGNLVSEVASPSLFNYDVLQSKKQADLLKNNECEVGKSYQQTSPNMLFDNLGWIYLIIIIVVIVIAYSKTRKHL